MNNTKPISPLQPPPQHLGLMLINTSSTKAHAPHSPQPIKFLAIYIRTTDPIQFMAIYKSTANPTLTPH